MIRRLACLSVGILIAQAFCMIPDEVVANTLSASNKRVEACHIETLGTQNALHQIAQKADVAIGIEAVQPERETMIVLDFPGGTVADLLNMFVTQSPDYRWREDGGIIHVFRKDAHVSLADVVISYPGARDQTRLQIWIDIAQRPEVSAWMKSTHCRRGDFFHAKEFKRHKGPISIAPGSLTVAQLLDEVALQSGVNYWAVLQSPPGHSCQVSVIVW